MKIRHKIKYFFLGLFKRIDKYIIVPITKLFVSFKKIFIKDNRSFEKLINKKSSLLIISLILSLIIFILVDTESIAIQETNAEVLYNQQVAVNYNEEAYVLEGVPEKVDITLIGRSSDLYLAKQIASNEVTLDLTGLKPGTHKVNLKYTKALETITYKLDPSVVTITIYPKVSEARTISYDVLNSEKLDSKLLISEVGIDRDEVIVKGSQATIDKVSSVKVLIDVDNIVDPTVGTKEATNLPLVAYDQKGQIVNIEIVPSKVNAQIEIASPKKEVPLIFMPKGELSFGKAIAEFDSNLNQLEIYGPEEVLAKINSIEIPLDVEGLKENKTYNLTIKKPLGVKYITENVVNVNLVLGDEVSKEFSNISISGQNLSTNLVPNIKNLEERTVTVIVKGVESVINAIDPTTIKAYVDLKGYTKGTYDVDIQIEKSDLRLNYMPKTKRVTITITEK